MKEQVVKSKSIILVSFDNKFTAPVAAKLDGNIVLVFIYIANAPSKYEYKLMKNEDRVSNTNYQNR